jgi:glycosyltransferase involved in cell wall biosynthesis
MTTHTDKRDFAVVHLTFEGVHHEVGGGVGSVIRDQLNTLPLVQQSLAGLGLRLTPYVYAIPCARSRRGYSDSTLRWARNQVETMGGELGVLPNYTSGDIPGSAWGNPELGMLENWKTASAGGATAVLNVAARHEHTVAYGHDTVFCLMPMYASLQAQAAGADLTAAWVVHSSALLHEQPRPNPERLMAESAAVQFPKQNERARLGAISDYMQRHLMHEYGASSGTFIPTGNGVNPLDPWYARRPDAQLRRVLERYGIPTDRPLVVSSGRAVEYKRHDQVLRAAAELEGRVHPVVQVYSDDPELRDLRHELGIAATVVAACDRELMATLVQWPHARAIFLPAVDEPFGLIPSEARLLARDGGAVVLAADSGGFSEQIVHRADGFLCSPDDVPAAAAVLAQICELSEEDRRDVREAGARRVLSEYTVAQQIARTLSACIPSVREVQDELTERLSAAIEEPLPDGRLQAGPAAR